MRSISARTAAAFLAGALTCGVLAAPSGAANRSLPRVPGTAPQPGPAALYQPLAKSPQLENAPRSGWTAKPILISGASAYGKGEYLYQGFIYDDRGVKEATDPSNPMHSPGGDASGNSTGPFPLRVGARKPAVGTASAAAGRATTSHMDAPSGYRPTRR